MPAGLIAFDSEAGPPTLPIRSAEAPKPESEQFEMSIRRVRIAKARQPAKARMRAVAVAIPAPSMPSSGIGPSPKMKIGSSTMLMMAWLSITDAAIRASPPARKTEFSACPATMKGKPRHHHGM